MLLNGENMWEKVLAKNHIKSLSTTIAHIVAINWWTFPDLSGNPDFCSPEKRSIFPVGGTIVPQSHAIDWKKFRIFGKFWVSSLC